MAIRGFVMGLEPKKTSTVSGPAVPSRKSASPTTLGEVVTVPPMKEELGDQIVDVPSMMALSSSPMYWIRPAVGRVPKAEPVEGWRAAEVQSAQMVEACAGFP